jgi:hypothetical protein
MIFYTRKNNIDHFIQAENLKKAKSKCDNKEVSKTLKKIEELEMIKIINSKLVKQN